MKLETLILIGDRIKYWYSYLNGIILILIMFKTYNIDFKYISLLLLSPILIYIDVKYIYPKYLNYLSEKNPFMKNIQKSIEQIKK